MRSRQPRTSWRLQRGQLEGDSRWAIPLAMAHWLEGRYSDALDALLEPSVAQASISVALSQPCRHGGPQGGRKPLALLCFRALP